MYTMSAPKVPNIQVSKPDSRAVSNRNYGNKQQNNSRRRFKQDRSCRKRSKSFSGFGALNPKPVLPTKFLLGGNINDPLNLNSLLDEETNKAVNAVTPKSSPLPTPPRKKLPIEVIVSPNTHDPLHLMDCKNDKEYEEHFCAPMKRARKKRIKRRRTVSASVEGCVPPGDESEAKTSEASTDSEKIPEDPEVLTCSNVSAFPKPADRAYRPASLDLDIEKKKNPKRRSEDANMNVSKKIRKSMDKIVSPVVPQPGSWLQRSKSLNPPRPKRNKVTDDTLPAFKEENKRFQYGNYNRYYGYRNPNNETDYRLKVFSYHHYIFENKDILDIGCNIGHITLSIARDFKAKTVTGIDIDPKLISIARKNVKHYVKTTEKSPCRTGDFPENVNFKQCNYVLEDESLLSLEQPQFDVIVCLSTTKWIHLNWGDNGLKLSFRRMYEQLRPGGKLILEPQHWASYKSKKKLTETIFRNYNAIDFYPDQFREYLLSPAVGFAESDILGFPQHHKTSGFKRPIQVFVKSTMFPSERVEATPKNPVTSTDAGVEHVYTNLLHSTPLYCEDQEENLDITESLSHISTEDKGNEAPANACTREERTITCECSRDVGSADNNVSMTGDSGECQRSCDDVEMGGA